MAILAKNPGGDFSPIPQGLHHAVCYGVVDVGTQPSANPKFPARRKVIFIWELPGERIEIVKDDKKLSLPRAISYTFTLSLASKGNLRPMLESWRGRAFTDQELDGFDVSKVAKANCYLNIVTVKKEDKTYSNVASVNPLPKGQKPISNENPVLVWSLDDHPNESTFPQNMPDWIKAKIMQSDEYIALEQRGTEPARGQREDNVDPDNDPADVPF